MSLNDLLKKTDGAIVEIIPFVECFSGFVGGLLWVTVQDTPVSVHLDIALDFECPGRIVFGSGEDGEFGELLFAVIIHDDGNDIVESGDLMLL